MTFDLITYLHRVGDPETSVSPEGLANLQIAQMRHIPFENIDVLLNKVPDIADAAIWQKLVTSRRGGYCFEQNALFTAALCALGFDTSAVLARVRLGAPTGGARTHRAIVATLDGVEWLTDVGFGGPGPRGPLRLADHEPQVVDGETFRVRHDESCSETVIERLTDDGWFSLYGFDRLPPRSLDFVAANLFCAKWENSPFTKFLMMTISRKDGRVTLFNRFAKYTTTDAVNEVEIASPEQLQNIFTNDFGIIIDNEHTNALWAHIKDAPKHRPE